MSFLSNIFSLSTLSTAIPYKKDPGKNRNLNKEPAPRKIFPSTHTLYNLKKKEKKTLARYRVCLSRIASCTLLLSRRKIDPRRPLDYYALGDSAKRKGILACTHLRRRRRRRPRCWPCRFVQDCVSSRSCPTAPCGWPRSTSGRTKLSLPPAFWSELVFLGRDCRWRCCWVGG